MEREEILQLILEQLDSIYELDIETIRKTYIELAKSSDEKLAEILKKLNEFRNGQLQNIHAFIRISDQKEITQKEEKERQNVGIEFDL